MAVLATGIRTLEGHGVTSSPKLGARPRARAEPSSARAQYASLAHLGQLVKHIVERVSSILHRLRSIAAILHGDKVLGTRAPSLLERRLTTGAVPRSLPQSGRAPSGATENECRSILRNPIVVKDEESPRQSGGRPTQLSFILAEALLVFRGLVLQVNVLPNGRRRSHRGARPSLDLFRGSKRLGRSSLYAAHVRDLAEVCRDRTDRSTIGRPTGFEVPGGHQPACTSRLMVNDFLI
jgi:hypothetical protein